MKHDRACASRRRHRPHVALVPLEYSQPGCLLEQEMFFHVLQRDERHPSNWLSWQFVPQCQYMSLYLTSNQLAAYHFLSSRDGYLLTSSVLKWINCTSQVSQKSLRGGKSFSRLGTGELGCTCWLRHSSKGLVPKAAQGCEGRISFAHSSSIFLEYPPIFTLGKDAE